MKVETGSARDDSWGGGEGAAFLLLLPPVLFVLVEGEKRAVSRD